MRPRTLLTALLLAGALIALPALSACGSENELDVAEGEPVELGDLQYNVVISRFLNAHDTEDAEYLVDQPPARADQLYLGAFLQVQNDGGSTIDLPSDFRVVDTRGEEYEPIESDSPYAFPLGEQVFAGGEVPVPDSTAATGPIEGSMVLFLISTDSAENRPLELEIPGSDEVGRVTLDI